MTFKRQLTDTDIDCSDELEFISTPRPLGMVLLMPLQLLVVFETFRAYRTFQRFHIAVTFHVSKFLGSLSSHTLVLGTLVWVFACEVMSDFLLKDFSQFGLVQSHILSSTCCILCRFMSLSKAVM